MELLAQIPNNWTDLLTLIQTKAWIPLAFVVVNGVVQWLQAGKPGGLMGLLKLILSFTPITPVPNPNPQPLPPTTTPQPALTLLQLLMQLLTNLKAKPQSAETVAQIAAVEAAMQTACKHCEFCGTNHVEH